MMNYLRSINKTNNGVVCGWFTQALKSVLNPSLAVAALLMAFSANVSAQKIQMLSDYDISDYSGISKKDQVAPIVHGDELIFSATNPLYGNELFATKGTYETTRLVGDLTPGAASSVFINMISVGTDIYFSTYQIGLGRIDVDGKMTILNDTLKTSLYTGTYAVLNGTLYFAASTDDLKTELWKTDGTPEGTKLVKDINPGLGSSSPNYLTVFNNKLAFSATAEGTGKELYFSDGTEAGTKMVKEIHVGVNSKEGPNNLVVLGDKLIFSAWTETENSELWMSDGTVSGTKLLVDLNSDPSIKTLPASLTVVGNRVIFSAKNSDNDYAIFTTDGTAANTQILVVPDSTRRNGNQLQSPCIINETAYFKVLTDVVGYVVYETDGTPAGTKVALDTAKYKFNYINDLKPYGNSLFLNVRNLDYTNAILKYTPSTKQLDTLAFPTKPGTDLLVLSDTVVSLYHDKNDSYLITKGRGGFLKESLIQKSGSAFPNSLRVFNNELFCVAKTPETGFEICHTDGNSDLQLFKEFYAGDMGSAPVLLAEMNGKLLFTVNIPEGNKHLFATDGTEAGTVLLTDTINGQGEVVALGSMKGKLYFTSSSSDTGTDIWVTDGTKAGTQMIDITEGDVLVQAQSWTFTDEHLYFNVFLTDARRIALYRTDGTVQGTEVVSGNTQRQGSLKGFKGKVYFTASDTSNVDMELWVSDGTTTELLNDLKTEGSSSPRFDWSSENYLYGIARPVNNAQVVYRTDGTAGGIVDLSSASKISVINILTVTNDQLLIYGRDSNNTDGLFYADASMNQLELLTELDGYNAVIPFKNRLWFTNKTDENGKELWVSDGTPEGTKLFYDIIPGEGSGEPLISLIADGTMYFTANNAGLGKQIWRTDGTLEGTMPLFGQDQSVDICDISSLVKFNGKIYFQAYSVTHGAELWYVASEQPSTFTLGQKTYVYDGAAKSIEVQSIEPDADYTISYQNAEGMTVETPTDAGTYYALIESVGQRVDTVIYAGQVKDSLVISKAALTVTAVDAEKVEGEDNPMFTLNYSGFVASEGESVLAAKPTATTDALADSPMGTYDIVVSGGEAHNYRFVYQNGVLTVKQAVSTTNMFGADVSLYPNPTSSGAITIELGEASDLAKVSVKDVLGNTVRCGLTRGAGTISLSINGSSGLYFVELIVGSEVLSLQVIKN